MNQEFVNGFIKAATNKANNSPSQEEIEKERIENSKRLAKKEDQEAHQDVTPDVPNN